MGRNIRGAVLERLKSNELLSAHQLSQELSVSRQYIHRVLSELSDEKSILKFGNPPRVQYQINRDSSLGKRGRVIWLTGSAGSGKTTLARLLEHHLSTRQIPCRALDADDLSERLNSDLSSSPKDHSEAIRRTAEAARLLIDCGVTVIVSTPAYFAADRNKARSTVGAHSFSEVFLDCPLEVSLRRSGGSNTKENSSLTYEPPQTPDLVVDTQLEQSESTRLVVEGLSLKN